MTNSKLLFIQPNYTTRLMIQYQLLAQASHIVSLGISYQSASKEDKLIYQCG